jgi:hypothetical protein
MLLRCHNSDPENIPHAHRTSNAHGATPQLLPHLSVPLEVEGVVPLPGLPPAGGRLVVAVALPEAAGLLAGGREPAGLAVLVDGLDDPVDARVAADGLVLGVDEDDLKVLVGRVLVDPVRVQDAQVSAAASNTLLGGGLERPLVLELVHSLVGGLACERWGSAIALREPAILLDVPYVAPLGTGRLRPPRRTRTR